MRIQLQYLMISVKAYIEVRIINQIANTVDIVFLLVFVEDYLQRRVLVGYSLDDERTVDADKSTRRACAIRDRKRDHRVVID
jgi:hypothetical protein